MPRRNHIPTYHLHKQSGQVIVPLTDGLGGRRDALLGTYGTPKNRAEYTCVLKEWETKGRRLLESSPGTSDLTVNELVLVF